MGRNSGVQFAVSIKGRAVVRYRSAAPLTDWLNLIGDRFWVRMRIIWSSVDSTAVSGGMLQAQPTTARRPPPFPNPTPRQWVDCSYPAYYGESDKTRPFPNPTAGSEFLIVPPGPSPAPGQHALSAFAFQPCFRSRFLFGRSRENTEMRDCRERSPLPPIGRFLFGYPALYSAAIPREETTMLGNRESRSAQAKWRRY